MGEKDDEIHILHVDDDSAQRELTSEFLRRENDSFVVHTDSNAGDALERLSAEPIDCIVSDYDMPQTNGLEFLVKVRETHPDLPFVLFTGKGNEEIASEAISVGVTEYMQKGIGSDQYRVLANRIRVTVDQYRAQRDADRASQRLERVLEQATDAYFALDTEWRFTYLNQRAEDLLRLDEGDVLGTAIWEPLPEMEESLFREQFEKAAQGDFSVSFEEYYLPLETWLEVHAFPSKEGLSVYLRDISDRKETERDLAETKQDYQTVFEGAFDAMIIADDEGNAVDVNPAACAMFDRPREELLGESFARFAVDGYDFEAEWEQFQQSDRDRGYFPFVLPDGSERIAEYGATTRISENQHLSVLRDVTERREAEETRKATFERMTDAFFALNTDWEFTYLNGRAEDLIQSPSESVLGNTIWEAFSEARGTEFEEQYRTALETQEPITFESYYGPFDTWYEIHAYPDEDGLSVFFNDVTDRRKLQEELRHERALLEQILDTSPVGIVLLEPDGQIVRANSRAEDVLSLQESEITARTYSDPDWKITDGEGERITDTELPFDRVVETGEPVYGYEHGIKHADGAEMWLSINAAPLTGESDELRHVVATVQDVTKANQIERELKASADALRRLYELTSNTEFTFRETLSRILELGAERLGMPFGFLAQSTDENQEIIEAHGSHERLRGGHSYPLSQTYCRRTIRTEGLLEVRNAVESGWADDPAYEAFELGSYIGGKVLVSGDRYGTLWFAATEPRSEPFTDSERSFVELLTQWVGYELERQRATANLKQKNEQLDEFASVVSHDLQNPLSVAHGNLELYRETGDEAYLRKSEGALVRMNQIIDDVLHLAREGKQVSDVEPVNLANLVSDCWENVVTEGRRLRVELEPDFTVEADRSRLKHVFENLFDNAIKYAGESVSIRIGHLENGFFVEDDGPGIPPGDRETVFEPGHTTADDGTGFGLSIVRDIVKAHGWTVAIRDGNGGGARFEVTW